MKRTRKGFTLVELLIVIAILGILSAAMSISGSKATAAAKANTIYNNITAIKTAALLYRMQEGIYFHEKLIDNSALEASELAFINEYNNEEGIKYAIVPGTAEGKGAYVICDFRKDSDFDAIANNLYAYRNIRVNVTPDTATVGAFLFYNTSENKTQYLYDVEEFKYPASESTGG